MKKTLIPLILFVAVAAWIVLRPWQVETEDAGPALSTPPTAAPTSDGPAPQRRASLPPPTEEFLPTSVLDSSEAIASIIDNDAITHRPLTSGSWSDPATWPGGNIPKDGARVRIPAGLEITLDVIQTAHLKALYIDGSLLFSGEGDSELTADTLVVNPDGRLAAGTAKAPVTGDADILISILPYHDPNEPEAARYHSARFISQGEVSLHGEEKSAVGLLAATPEIGEQVLTFTDAPLNWQPDDLLTIGGGRLSRDETETLRIVSVAGNRVTVTDAALAPNEQWQGLETDYGTPRDTMAFAVNLTRNVAISSEAPSQSESVFQGALLFHGDGVGGASLGNVGIYGLGMREGIEDGLGTAQTRDAITFQPGSGAEINGMVVVDAPDSNIVMDDASVTVANSAAFDEDGSAWLTETGSTNRLVWSGPRTPKTLRTSAVLPE